MTSKRKGPTLEQLRRRGYHERHEVVEVLRFMADDLEKNDDGQLVKHRLELWFEPKPKASQG